MHEVAAILSSGRDSSGLSLSEVAALVSKQGVTVTSSMIGKILRGDRHPDPHTAASIARAVGLNPAPVVLALAGISDDEASAPSDFAAVRRHQLDTAERRAHSIEVLIEGDRDGSAVVRRTFYGVGPRADGTPIPAIPIADHATHPIEAGGVQVVAAPVGINYTIVSEPVPGGYKYLLQFPDGWGRYSASDGFTLELMAEHAGWFLANPTKPVSRHSQHLTWRVDHFTIALRFACGWLPSKAKPRAWFGRDQVHPEANVIDRVCESAKITIEGTTMRLSVARPLAGYSYAIVWPSVAHSHDKEGKCVLSQPSFS